MPWVPPSKIHQNWKKLSKVARNCVFILVGRPSCFPIKLKLRAATSQVPRGVGSSQVVFFWMPLGSFYKKAFSLKKWPRTLYTTIQGRPPKIALKNREIGHILGMARSYRKLFGPMRSPSGGAYLVSIPHPTTPQWFLAVLGRNSRVLWGVGYKNDKNCELCNFLWNTQFFLTCGILLPVSIKKKT